MLDQRRRRWDSTWCSQESCIISLLEEDSMSSIFLGLMERVLTILRMARVWNDRTALHKVPHEMNEAVNRGDGDPNSRLSAAFACSHVFFTQTHSQCFQVQQQMQVNPETYPANTRHSANAGLTLDQRRRRSAKLSIGWMSRVFWVCIFWATIIT